MYHPTTQTNRLPRVLLRTIDHGKRTDREDIFRVTFGKLDAPLTRLSDTANGFYAVSDDVRTIDKLLTDKAITELAKINLQPVIPPDVRARRTIFVRQVDRIVGTKTADEIKTELETQQHWLRITEIIKIKDYTHVFKIICNETTMADRILTDGLKAFNTRLTPGQCEQERFTHLLICYKCYDYDKHPTKDCPQTYDICSECATKGHTFRDCKSTTKACINCRTDDHRTLAAKCPYRKTAIRDKETKQKDDTDKRQNQTYAAIAKTAIQQTVTPPAPIVTITSKTHLKLTALILEAHIASLTERQSYGDILSKSLKDNFDIDAKFPDRDSQKLFNIYYKPQDTDKDNDMETDFYIDDDHRRSSLNISGNLDLIDNDAPSVRPKTKQLRTDSTSPKKHRSTSTKTSRRTSIDRTKRKATTDPDPIPTLATQWTEKVLDKQLGTIEADAIGLKLFRSSLDKTRLPDKIDKDYVYKGLQQKDFGLKMTATLGDPKTILTLIRDGTIRLTHNQIQTVTNDQFRRMQRIAIEPPHKRQKHSPLQRH